jgi:hypothetical protein
MVILLIKSRTPGLSSGPLLTPPGTTKKRTLWAVCSKLLLGKGLKLPQSQFFHYLLCKRIASSQGGCPVFRSVSKGGPHQTSVLEAPAFEAGEERMDGPQPIIFQASNVLWNFHQLSCILSESLGTLSESNGLLFELHIYG